MKKKFFSLFLCFILVVTILPPTSAKYSKTNISSMNLQLYVNAYTISTTPDDVKYNAFDTINATKVTTDENQIVYYEVELAGITGPWEKFLITLDNLTKEHEYEMQFACTVGMTRNDPSYHFGCAVFDMATAEKYLKIKYSSVPSTSLVEFKDNSDKASAHARKVETLNFTASGTEMGWLWDVSDIPNETVYTSTIELISLKDKTANKYLIGSNTSTSSLSLGASFESTGMSGSGNTYYIDTNGVYGISIPEIEMMGNNWPVGVDTMLTLEPNAGCKLPTTIYVSVGGSMYEIPTAQNALSSSTVNYVNGIEFDTSTKELYIPASMITGTVEIIANAQ